MNTNYLYTLIKDLQQENQQLNNALNQLSNNVSNLSSDVNNLETDVNPLLNNALGDMVSVEHLLQNGWVQQLAVGYYKDVFGKVQLIGRVSGGTDSNGTVIFTLPPEARPFQSVIFKQRGGVIYVENNGNVAIYDYVHTYVALDGISFRTNGLW